MAPAAAAAAVLGGPGIKKANGRGGGFIAPAAVSFLKIVTKRPFLCYSNVRTKTIRLLWGRRPRVADFDLIYNRYFTAVYCYARGLTRSERDAEELTAETFFKALQAIDRFDERGDLRVWLCQIAKYTWFNQQRRRKREMPLDEEQCVAEDAMSRASALSMAEALEDRDTARRLFALLHRMEEPYKEVFTLRTFCEQPHAQIAALFGKTESWARVTYHRAKTKLLQELEETANGEC